MHRTRNALLALVTAAVVVAPLPATASVSAPTAVTTAKLAKPKSKPKVAVKNLITTTDATLAFSPNGDKARDRVRVPYTLKRKSMVTVKVFRPRSSGDAKVVFSKELGRVSRGKHAFKWDGKKRSGKVLQDRRYQVSVFADPVKKHLKKASDYTYVEIDTRYTPRQLQASSTTVYPNTTVVTDRIGFNHSGPPASDDTAWERVHKVTLVVTNAAGEVVRSSPQPYPQDYSKRYPVTWDGRGDSGAPAPAGTYTVQLDVTDMAGNTGTSPGLAVTVSAAPLVMASGTRTVAPVNGTLPPAPAGARTVTRDGGRASTNGGDDSPTEPCGSVFASAVYPGGASFWSKAHCGWALNEARAGGSLELSDLNAPRDLMSVRLSMRGRPTIDGETDTAQIALGSGWQGYRTSPAVPGEAVTSTPIAERAWDATTGYGIPRRVEWRIRTVGFDAYDVADVTVDYTYLTPQAS